MTFTGVRRARRPLVVVTGAARRVGAAIAVELARSGADLLLVCRAGGVSPERTVEAAGAAARERGEEAKIEVVSADLSDPGSVESLAERLARIEVLDGIVHNASSYGRTPWGTIGDAEAVRHFRTNALAPLLLTQAVSASLARSTLPGGGAVICFGDIHVMGRPRRGYAAYGMSKAALGHLVEALARELAPQVRVNGIAPGVIAWPEDTPDHERQAYERRIPLGRSGTPEDAAAVVRWLIFEAPYVTGEILRLDGGRWLT